MHEDSECRRRARGGERGLSEREREDTTKAPFFGPKFVISAHEKVQQFGFLKISNVLLDCQHISVRLTRPRKFTLNYYIF